MTDLEVLKIQRDYLARYAAIPARLVDFDYDPAGSTTSYEPDPKAVELFGEKALCFSVGCGSSPSTYRIIAEGLEP